MYVIFKMVYMKEIVWRANMEKTAQRNIMAIYEIREYLEKY